MEEPPSKLPANWRNSGGEIRQRCINNYAAWRESDDPECPWGEQDAAELKAEWRKREAIVPDGIRIATGSPGTAAYGAPRFGLKKNGVLIDGKEREEGLKVQRLAELRANLAKGRKGQKGWVCDTHSVSYDKKTVDEIRALEDARIEDDRLRTQQNKGLKECEHGTSAEGASSISKKNSQKSPSWHRRRELNLRQRKDTMELPFLPDQRKAERQQTGQASRWEHAIASGEQALLEWGPRLRLSVIRPVKVPRTHVKIVCGVERCVLCDKEATESHLTSAGHLEKTAREFFLDGVIGPAKEDDTGSVRRLTDGRINRGQPGTPYDDSYGITVTTKKQAVRDGFPLLTKQSTREYWGESVENLAAIAGRIIKDKDFMVKVSENKAALKISRTSIKGTRVALVSYKGSGKYEEENRLVCFDEIPDSDELVRDDYVERTRIPQNQGWWPVVIVDVDEREEALQNRGEKKKLLVTCIYQLQEASDGYEIAGWWILSDPISGFAIGYEHGDEPEFMHAEDLGEEYDDGRTSIPQAMRDAAYDGVEPENDQ